MNTKNLLVVGLPALLCGALLGYFVHTPEAPVVTQPAQVKPAKTRSTASSTDAAALNRLRHRVQDLERQLAAARAQPAATAETEKPVAASTNAPSPFAWGRGGGFPSAEEIRARMEEFRKNDPEHYAQMTNHFARMQAHRLERTQNRLDLLASVDTSRMTKKQRAVHEQYQDLIARREELRALMNPQDESITEEQRQAAFKEMRELGGKLHELAQSERDTLLAHTAASFGIQGDEAGELVETVKAVYQATENHGGWGGHGPGGHGRGGRGGPGGMPPPPPAR